ncbi:hypothetical protein [Bacillus infantis]|uniref:hypothetical protein n=1 Tax=Bacillus infantis TaxID=324767 RepID=UPI00209CE648|nr:hypothetical protein [Bacillus infantis]MCP1159261.1 hypothetical protein [Bacillus infantis]
MDYVTLLTGIVPATLSLVGSIYIANNEIKKLKNSNDVEIEKLKQQSANEISKIKAEMESQIELKQKISDIEMENNFINKFLLGDEKVLNNLERIIKFTENGNFKNNNHPAKKKR